MINNIIYGIVVLVILFSLYHFIKDLFIFYNDFRYSDNFLTRIYSKIRRFNDRYL